MVFIQNKKFKKYQNENQPECPTYCDRVFDGGWKIQYSTWNNIFWQKMTKLGQKPSLLGKKYLEPRNLNERHD